ncbi:hypothetical protein [Clostridium algidicarnis]|uniref:hypothetical protein n=1 Tax=Clostridium algidicarnis TaxID=37659 RepID=UPI001C0E5ECB|nr:hypothetical protein [Clostridium algidicarnis]MBU3194644.1 hypothetical protein [Clostridium algidicarnis]MBU3207830.1 hypothetical protein [Clostridium algidicarnis]
MKKVGNLNELKINCKTLDKYLEFKKDPEYSFVLGLIKKGTCFVTVQKGGKYEFYPSRFVGYVDNDIDIHLKNEKKDGRETNLAISKILGGTPIPNTILENLYSEYCEFLGFTANEKGSFNVERKYWEAFNID